jgi:hypothetical protein
MSTKRQIRLIKAFIFISLLYISTKSSNIYAQDTLSGNYKTLIIKSGKYLIKETVTVTDKLTILPGAKIEISDPGVLVCEGEVDITGDSKNLIEIYGTTKLEGNGLIIRGVDSVNKNKINISNTIFRNLQFPVLFDFGWHRESVNLSDNYFINNIGKLSLIQVLNTPFNYNVDSAFVDFKIQHNLFSGNNSSIYFEDLKSDHVKYNISNNTFYGNNVYGSKNYNISTNFLHARMDQSYNKYLPTIINNSFISNYLIDNLTDTVAHLANFGVYGSEKSISLINNYFGFITKEQILNGFYDQTINYSVPKINFEPFLLYPNISNPSHIYEIKNLDDSINMTLYNFKKQLKGFKLTSNNPIDYKKSILHYIYFKDDSSLVQIDTVLSYNLENKDLESTFLITSFTNSKNNVGYYNLTNIFNKSGDYVPDVKIGHIQFLKEIRRRFLISKLLNEKLAIDTLKKIVYTGDSLKNIFQKVDKPIKSRIEVGAFTGSSIFTGTISNKGNIFSNIMNLLLGINIEYTLNSKLNAGLDIASFNLSNTDTKSNNNDQAARGMSFTTRMLSISPMINYEFIDNRLYSKARRIKPSVGFGIDIVSFTPKGIYNGVSYNLQSLGTGGQYADSTKKPYSLLALGYFFTFKVKYQLNRQSSVGFNMSYHRSMSDYLDDVGPDSYPTVASLMKSNVTNKDAAIFFSNPTSRNVIGQYRNSPDNAKDSYLNFSIIYSRKLFK